MIAISAVFWPPVNMIVGIEASHANKLLRTGVDEYSWQIINHLKQIIPADVRVILYSQTPLTGDLGDLPENWQSRVLPWPWKLWSQIRLSIELWKHPPDVFFAPGQLVPAIAPKNTVATVHDSAFMVFPKAYRFFSRLYLRFMNRMVLNKSRMILTPSEFSRRELKRLYNFDTNRVSVTPLGFNKAIYKKIPMNFEEKNEILKKFEITKPFFIFVGRLEQKKNVANIVRAFDKIKKQYDCALVLVGMPGCGYKEVEEVIKNSQNKNDIILSGWLDSEMIAKLYNFAEAMIFPSNYEGFGLPVLEAMASGCPVIVSKGNSLTEVAENAAIIVEPESTDDIAASAIQMALNRDLRNKYVESGIARAGMFSWENTAKLTWQVLREAGK